VLERRAVVRVREGLHARPAAAFVKLARSFAADLEIICADRSANAKSAVKLMLLGVKEADEIVIRGDGEDAAAAVESLANFVADGAGEAAPSPISPTTFAARVETASGLRGVAASEGVSLGPTFAFSREALVPPRRVIAEADIAAETMRMREACLAAAMALDERRRLEGSEAESREIIDALREIVGDPALSERIAAIIASGLDAVSATIEAGDGLAADFAALEDPYQRARAEDIRAVARQIALELLGRKDRRLSEAPAGSVILAEALSAFDLAGVALDRLGGLVCLTGGASSHIAIMARAGGLPAVLGLKAEPSRLYSARFVALNGATGEVALDPDETEMTRFHDLRAKHVEDREGLRRYAAVEPRTRDGRLVEIAANLGSLKEIEAAHAVGAMGVGLFRTEFLFMEKRRLPSEDEQTEVYAKLAAAFAPWPVIIRTLDAGGDKPVPGVEFPSEENPFLGWRGVRLCLDRPDIFKPQLRALLRAAIVGNVKIMVPMIADVAEVRAARRLMDVCRAELVAEGIPHGMALLGAMVETPAAALLADELAEAADFFSIGANDLTQYVMAADRTNPRVAHLNRADHPAVMKAIALTCEAARRAGLWVGICGEAAARPDLIPAFVAMGVNELSMSATSILRAKKCVAEL
jgi:phosphoenolpyruvate-protein phosphotransferase (PTS system enzyme I)